MGVVWLAPLCVATATVLQELRAVVVNARAAGRAAAVADG